MIIVHSPRCLGYAADGHPECPERVLTAVAELEESDHVWIVPEPCADADLLRVHTQAMIDAVKSGQFFDADTPFFPDIYELGRLSAGGAIVASEQALAGHTAFSLMRPPGHHAERSRVMGFCYFNNIAIAVARLLGERGVERAAILDFDCHHGNGTEDIFLGDDRVLFVSLHQSPCYPNTGLVSRKNCVSYPLAPATGAAEFLAAFDDALAKISDFKPQLLAISAGFDAYKLDPITQMGLEIDTFGALGERVATFCHRHGTGATPLPSFGVLEGGYSRDFARCVDAFVTAWGCP
ncbi:MAG TPA: histone deacetylase [Verrucomicrobiae bacterium]|nr:histone deacetylase [Verrucomicrobiae bacterium]